MLKAPEISINGLREITCDLSEKVLFKQEIRSIVGTFYPVNNVTRLAEFQHKNESGSISGKIAQTHNVVLGTGKAGQEKTKLSHDSQTQLTFHIGG